MMHMVTSNAAQQIMNISDMPTPALESLIHRKLQELKQQFVTPLPVTDELQELFDELAARARSNGDASL